MDKLQEFAFTEKAALFSTSMATITLYQVLLGRDPENSHVIEEAKAQRIDSLFQSFLRSAEFADFVIAPMKRGERLRHELTGPAPNSVQREWLTSLLVLPPARRESINTATSWREMFRALLPFTDERVSESLNIIVPEPLPVAPAGAPAADPSLMADALAEITEIEQRLTRLKALLRETGDKISKATARYQSTE